MYFSDMDFTMATLTKSYTGLQVELFLTLSKTENDTQEMFLNNESI